MKHPPTDSGWRINKRNSEKSLQTFLRTIGASESFNSLAELFGDHAIFAIDENREIMFWSKGAEKILGFPADQVMGHHCLKANRCHNCMVGCGLIEYRELKQIPLILYRADGHPVALRKTAKAFFDKEGNFIGGLEVLTPDKGTLKEPIPKMPSDTVNFHGLMSRSPQIHRVFEIVRNAAKTDITILIRGESGTGKELIAKAIHKESHRKDGPFLSINCAAITPTLLESELFGHVKGAFTGAVRDRPGLFERADGGTLFLDEVAELPMELQAKLLRILQEQSFFSVGSTQETKVDVRIIGATHSSLRDMVNQGTFREDLMYRLRVVPIYLSPLRERRVDIEPLLWHFIGLRNKKGQRQILRIEPEAMKILLNHRWPGNVRELQNVLDYAFVVGREPEMKCSDLPPEFAEEVLFEQSKSMEQMAEPSMLSQQASRSLLQNNEVERIKMALQHSNGHIGKAAEMLEMSRPTFWRKRKKYGV